jgi:hypothetical protein
VKFIAEYVHNVRTVVWCELFKNDCISSVDDHLSRCIEAATPVTVQCANGLIQENLHITLDEMCADTTLVMGVLTP